MVHFLWSLKWGKPAGNNPWGAAGLEWTIPLPPPTENFDVPPVVTQEAYHYPLAAAAQEEARVGACGRDPRPPA
jgi:cytochrome c oxidase subunit 1